MNRDSRNILIILIILTVFKGLFSAPLYLLDDEAYYWVWSKNLSLSYFDHPPMIALLIRLSTVLFGESAFGIRALGAILTSISIWFGLDLIYRIYQDKKVLWHGLALYSLAIPFFAAGTIMTPDTPMMFFITLALWASYRAVFEFKNRYWWISGLAFGLALLSKYTAILWLGSVFLVLVIDPRLRRHLRQSAPWLAGLLAIAIFLPVLYWNATHGWVSFKFQLAHGLQSKNPRPLFYLGEFFGGQAGLITPGIFLTLLVLWGKMTAHWSKLLSQERFLLITGFLPFLFFLYAGSRSHVEANWPALAYFSGLILVAVWHARSSGWKKWVRGINYGLLALLMTIVIIQPHFKMLPLTGKNDPTNRYYGWPGVLDRIEKIWQENPSALPVGNKYQLQSQLAYRLGTIRIPALNIQDRPNHFDYFDESILAGRDLLIISGEKNPRPQKFEQDFESVVHLESISGYRDDERVRNVQVYLGKNFDRNRFD